MSAQRGLLILVTGQKLTRTADKAQEVGLKLPALGPEIESTLELLSV